MFGGAKGSNQSSSSAPTTFILLVTENPLNAIYAGNQLSIRNILRGKGIKWVEVDGVQSVERRNELFGISEKCGCKRGEYPQLFCVEAGGDTVFWGDYTQVQELNDTGELAAKVAAANSSSDAIKSSRSKFRRRSTEMNDVQKLAASNGPEAADVNGSRGDPAVDPAAQPAAKSAPGTTDAVHPYEVVMPMVFQAAAEAGVGLVCWVVDGRVLKLYPNKEINRLHVGDSYVFLSTHHVNDKPLQDINADVGLRRSVHIWLGSESSIDHNAIAAFEAVELANFLHNASGPSAAIHRSVQGEESPEFLSLFKGTALHFLPGGIQSSLHHVKEGEKVQSLAVRTRLLHLKGRHACRCVELPAVMASLNHGDAFILEHDSSGGGGGPATPKLFVWFGKQANIFERAQATRVARQIHDEERHGNTNEAIVIVNELNAKDTNEASLLGAFWAALGGSAAGSSKIAEGTDDEVGDRAFEAEVDAATTLLRLEDSDEMKLHLSWKKQAKSSKSSKSTAHQQGRVLVRGMLNDFGAFILDTPAECFVWIGHQASERLRKNAFKRAIEYINGDNSQKKGAKGAKGKAGDKRMTRLVQHAETTTFKCFFHEWSPPLTSEQLAAMNDPTKESHIAEAQEVAEIDVAALIKAGEMEAVGGEEDGLAAPFVGSVRIWRVHSNKASAVMDQRRYGYFFDDCCYIVHQYSEVSDKGGQKAPALEAVYVWIGGVCALTTRGNMRAGAAMLISQKMLEEEEKEQGARDLLSKGFSVMSTNAVTRCKVAKWRLVQGKEPASFLRLFNGVMVVLRGAAASDGPVATVADNNPQWWKTCMAERQNASKVSTGRYSVRV
jgi:hypothetical protein